MATTNNTNAQQPRVFEFAPVKLGPGATYSIRIRPEFYKSFNQWWEGSDVEAGFRVDMKSKFQKATENRSRGLWFSKYAILGIDGHKYECLAIRSAMVSGDNPDPLHVIYYIYGRCDWDTKLPDCPVNNY